MPVTPSAAKALRNSEAKRARNSVVKAELKRQLKNVTAETLSKVVSLIDKNAKRNLIHENKAARLKAQLAKRFSGATAESAPVKKKSTVAKKTSAKATAARKTAKARAATVKKK